MLIIHSEIRIRNCQAEVYLNGMPIVMLGRTTQTFDSRPVHQYLVEGQNEFEVLINPGPTPSQARSAHPDPAREAPDAAVVARLVGYQEGQFVDQDGEDFVTLEWGWKRDGAAWATSLRGHSVVPTTFGTWAWQRAPRLELDRATIAEVEGVVRTVHHAFERRQPDEVVALSRVWLEDLAHAYPVRTPQQQIDEFKHNMVSDADKPDWRVAPLIPKEFDFRLCAGGRLIECVNTEWQPLVRSYIGDRADMPFPMLLGRHQGRLQRLR